MSTGPIPAPAAEVVLHQERMRVDLQQTETGRVVFRRRIVTEVRQVEVTVRREELVVEQTALTGTAVGAGRGDGGVPGTARRLPLVIVLSEEVPTVQLHTRPYERITVDVHTVTEQQVMTATVSRELAEVSEQPDYRDKTLPPA